ncbi:MAG: hypothetical protein KC613_08810 [Myxococcales bacterium]|nr:hypothetical protein [Myxococcales bacterium]
MRSLSHLWPLAALLALGCNADPKTTDDAGPPDAGEVQEGTPFVTQRLQIPARTPVDLLLVIDDSGSMCEEQNNLTRALNALPAELLEADLRAAVITTDMRNPERMGRFQADYARQAAPNCPEAPVVDGCPETLSPVLSAADADGCGDDRACRLAEMGTRLGCMAQQGTGGDGFEAGLAALRAATACDGPNAEHFAPCCVDGRFDPTCPQKPAFLRPEGLLVVLIVSDEDDCSDDPADPISRATNSTCEWDHARLVPVDAYRDHLAALKARPAEQIVVVPVVGPQAFDDAGRPVRYRPPAGDADVACLDENGAYDPALDPDGACCTAEGCPGMVQTTCESGLGAAFAGHRYLALAEAFGQPVTEEDATICVEAGWADRLTAPVSALHGVLCLDRAPACRRAVNFVSGDAGRPCDAAEAEQPMARSVAVSVNGRALGPGEYEVTPEANCPGGFALHLTEAPAPEATLIVRYVPEN